MVKAWKLLLYFCFLIVLFFALAEVVLRARGNKPWEVYKIRRTIEPLGEKFFMPHPKLGYINHPGKFKVTLNNSSYSFNVTNLDNSLRVTRALDTHDGTYSNKEIWIFGDSFTYGWGVNNEETYPWLLQEEFTNYKVLNFGISGYGPLHSLIQFKEAIKNNEKPCLVILAYASFHDMRNTSSRSRGKRLKRLDKANWNLIEPYVRIDRKGILHYAMSEFPYREFPFMRQSAFINWLEIKYDMIQDIFYQNHWISKLLIKEFSQLCQKNNIKFVIAGIMADTLTYDMLEYCKKEGIAAIDISIPYNNETTILQDGHPNATGHKMLAEKLIYFLSPVLE